MSPFFKLPSNIIIAITLHLIPILILYVAEEKGGSYPLLEDLSGRKLSELLFPSERAKPGISLRDLHMLRLTPVRICPISGSEYGQSPVTIRVDRL